MQTSLMATTDCHHSAAGPAAAGGCDQQRPGWVLAGHRGLDLTSAATLSAAVTSLRSKVLPEAVPHAVAREPTKSSRWGRGQPAAVGSTVSSCWQMVRLSRACVLSVWLPAEDKRWGYGQTTELRCSGGRGDIRLIFPLAVGCSHSSKLNAWF